jgi:RNA polymerase sigma-70 factor, ECF subfamily
MNTSDREMVRNCLQGNEAAWAALVRSYERRVFGMSYRFTRCRAEAEDVAQDVFVRVYQTLHSYRAEAGTLSGWLTAVAGNLLIDRHHRARRQLRCEPMGDTDLSIRDSRAVDPLQHLARIEAGAMVRAALRRLAPRNRDVLVLHDLEGLAFCDVAAILHIPVGTVKSRMMRGRRELARILRSRAQNSSGTTGNRMACPRLRTALDQAS